MKVIFLNVEEKKPPEVMEIDGELDTIKKLIGCNGVDSTLYKIGNATFRIYLDDTGVKKENYKESAYSPCRLYPLVGNLVLVGENARGESKSLSDNLAEQILRRIIWDRGYYRLYAD